MSKKLDTDTGGQPRVSVIKTFLKVFAQILDKHV